MANPFRSTWLMISNICRLIAIPSCCLLYNHILFHDRFFQGLAHLDILTMLKNCETVWKPSLFKTDVMGHVVDVFWNEAIIVPSTISLLQYLPFWIDRIGGFFLIREIYCANDRIHHRRKARNHVGFHLRSWEYWGRRLDIWSFKTCISFFLRILKHVD